MFWGGFKATVTTPGERPLTQWDKENYERTFHNRNPSHAERMHRARNVLGMVAYGIPQGVRFLAGPDQTITIGEADAWLSGVQREMGVEASARGGSSKYFGQLSKEPDIMSLPPAQRLGIAHLLKKAMQLKWKPTQWVRER